MTCNVQHLFICLFAVCISSLVRCLCRSFAHFIIVQYFFMLILEILLWTLACYFSALLSWSEEMPTKPGVCIQTPIPLAPTTIHLGLRRISLVLRGHVIWTPARHLPTENLLGLKITYFFYFCLILWYVEKNYSWLFEPICKFPLSDFMYEKHPEPTVPKVLPVFSTPFSYRQHILLAISASGLICTPGCNELFGVVVCETDEKRNIDAWEGDHCIDCFRKQVSQERVWPSASANIMHCQRQQCNKKERKISLTITIPIIKSLKMSLELY